MQIPCISCQSRFRLDGNFVKATGSLVRCSKCNYIFRVFPPNADEEPVLEDPNIDQSILDDLLRIEQTNDAKSILEQTSGDFKNFRMDEIASIHGFDEVDDSISEMEDDEYAELPDISEYEDMVDWSDSPDEADLTQYREQNSSSNQNSDK